MQKVHYVHFAFSCPKCDNILFHTVDIVDFRLFGKKDYLEEEVPCPWGCPAILILEIEKPKIKITQWESKKNK